MNAKKVERLFARFQRANPSPRIELKFRTPFELLVAVVLSAQATDVSVNQATDALFRVAKTPKCLLALGETRLKKYIRHVGLYNSKAKNLIAMCRQLLARHGGKVPNTRDALEALSGVGRKTASVVLNVAFDVPAVAVDTHVFRVANRTGLAPGKDVEAVEKKLLRVIPARFLKQAHYWLILHGRYVCKARKPRCPECLIRDLCEYPEKTE